MQSCNCFKEGSEKRSVNRGHRQRFINQVTGSFTWNKGPINQWSGWPCQTDPGVTLSVLGVRSFILALILSVELKKVKGKWVDEWMWKKHSAFSNQQK